MNKTGHVVLFFCLSAFLLTSWTASAATFSAVSICLQNGVYNVVSGATPGCVVEAELVGQLNETGWDRLALVSSPAFPDDVQAYAAGLAEGVVTANQIWAWWTNFVAGDFGGRPPSPQLADFINQHIQWARSYSEQVWNQTRLRPQAFATVGARLLAPLQSAFWRQVYLLFRQLDGITDGVNRQVPSQSLSFFQIYLLNSAGDLEDLIGVYQDLPVQNPFKIKYEDLPGGQIMSTGMDCSAFVKPVGKQGDYFADLVFGHTTWTSYYSLNRVFKQYTLHFNDPFVKASTVSFSSRPAFVSSKDDYYVNSAGLGSQETTNSILDRSLYNKLTPESIFCFMRSVIANRLADTGDLWTELFGYENSGTYNNQWMVVDTKRFAPGRPIQPGTLWIIEQIPGYTQRADVSSVLASQGYWPSYNVPYFAKVYNISGYSNGSAIDGQGLAYVTAPRAYLFKEYQGQVQSIEQTKWLLQYNNYKYDFNVSQGDPAIGISSRYDLRQQKGAAFGGIDSKISSFRILSAAASKGVITYAISGPSHEYLPPFNWANWPQVTHTGQPELWDFTWQTIVQRYN